MLDPCLVCCFAKKCRKFCNYKRDYNKHKRRKMKEQVFLYNFDKFLEWLDTQSLEEVI